MQNENSVII